MNNSTLTKAGILTLLLLLGVLLCWEVFLRSRGFDLSYDDDPALWSDKRVNVYEPASQATVFIGSSRIKFDLDIATWQEKTGDHAIQLACVGSSPVPILEDISNDINFKGKLIIDVTEGLFFSSSPGNLRRPKENLKYLKNYTPAQQASFQISHLLESKFVFLDKEWLSLNALLNQLPLHERNDIYNFRGFPSSFGRVKFNRQEYMTDDFATDTNLQNKVKNIWESFGKMSKEPPMSGGTLDSMMSVVKNAVDKIKARGGQVLFVRTPSTGSFLTKENKGYPRSSYWDKLLEITNCAGIHFVDYPVMNRLPCPEYSHLSQSDAIVFTHEFIRILVEEQHWAFTKLISSKN